MNETKYIKIEKKELKDIIEKLCYSLTNIFIASMGLLFLKGVEFLQ